MLEKKLKEKKSGVDGGAVVEVGSYLDQLILFHSTEDMFDRSLTGVGIAVGVSEFTEDFTGKFVSCKERQREPEKGKRTVIDGPSEQFFV